MTPFPGLPVDGLPSLLEACRCSQIKHSSLLCPFKTVCFTTFWQINNLTARRASLAAKRDPSCFLFSQAQQFPRLAIINELVSGGSALGGLSQTHINNEAVDIVALDGVIHAYHARL